MKRCPQCNRVETDDTLAFCRLDGTGLISEPGAVGQESATVKFVSPSGSSQSSALSSTIANEEKNRSTMETAALPRQPSRSLTRELTKSKRSKAAIVWISVLVLGVAGVAIWIYKAANQRQKKAGVSLQSAKISRLTTSGKVTIAAISPDGKYVAHVIDDAGRQSIWVRQVATQSNVEITQPAEVKYYGLVFSADGNYVYYTVEEKDGSPEALFQVPSLGGAARKIRTDIVGEPSFSPDGKRFAFFTYSLKDAEDVLMLANADGSNARKLAGRRGDEQFYRGLTPAPSWSPDGKTIISPAGFTSPENYMTVVAVSTDSGALKFFTSQKWAFVNQVAWLADGSGALVVGLDEFERSQIWQISYPDGSAQPVTNDLNNYGSISLDANSNALVTVQSERVANIFIASTNDPSHLTQITSGRHLDNNPSWAPDGTMVYDSDTGGKGDLYVMDAHGGNTGQLTTNSNYNLRPVVSPDGRYIAFESGRGGPHIWRMDRDGSNPKELTDRFDFDPQWTPDSQWIVYSSAANNGAAIRRVSVSGGQPVQLNQEGTYAGAAAVAPDGKQVACYYLTDPNGPPKLSIVPIDGGTPTKTFQVELNIRNSYFRWTRDGRAIVYLLTRGGVTNLWAQPVDGGAPKQLTNFTSDLIFAFDFSRDGKQLALSRGTRTSDVILISNFTQ